MVGVGRAVVLVLLVFVVGFVVGFVGVCCRLFLVFVLV